MEAITQNHISNIHIQYNTNPKSKNELIQDETRWGLEDIQQLGHSGGVKYDFQGLRSSLDVVVALPVQGIHGELCLKNSRYILVDLVLDEHWWLHGTFSPAHCQHLGTVEIHPGNEGGKSYIKFRYSNCD